MAKGNSKKENSWLFFGRDCRKFYQQGTGAARSARQITRRMLNKARRISDKEVIKAELQSII